MLDPFAGSGTTLVEARVGSARAVGTELLAPAVLAARVKTHFELSPRASLGTHERFAPRASAARTALSVPPRDAAPVRPRGALPS